MKSNDAEPPPYHQVVPPQPGFPPPMPPPLTNNVPTENQAQVQWMPPPVPIPNCPPGLEYMSVLDRIIIHQQADNMIAYRNTIPLNKFVIKNKTGQQCYYAHEESSACVRHCCNLNRGFVLHVVDNSNKEVIRVTRDIQCCKAEFCGCCWCAGLCPDQVMIESPPGQHIATFTQQMKFCASDFELDCSGCKMKLQVEGPSCVMCSEQCCQSNTSFKIVAEDEEIGKIDKKWCGLQQGIYINASNFDISFPQDLDVRAKAALVASAFLLDMKYFERNRFRIRR